MAYASAQHQLFQLNPRLPAPTEAVRKAYELRERVSEREKLYIVSHYED